MFWQLLPGIWVLSSYYNYSGVFALHKAPPKDTFVAGMRELGIGVFDLLESLCNYSSNGFDFFSGLDGRWMDRANGGAGMRRMRRV